MGSTTDVYILALEQLLNGRPVVNTFAFRTKFATDPTSGDFQALADILANRLNNSQVNDLQYVSWRAVQVRGAGASYSTTPPFQTTTIAFSGTYTGTVTGALTNTPLPNNNALCVTVNSAQSGRRRKGRFFLGGIAEVWVDDNSLVNATELANLQTDLNILVGLYDTSGTDPNWEMGVWSNRIATNAKYVWTTSGPVLTSQGAPSPSTAYIGMTSLTAQPFVASQRNRRPGL